MSRFDTNESLERLVGLVAPPMNPLEIDQVPAVLKFGDGRAVEFPPDFLALIQRYGSGEFNAEGDIGMIVALQNPRSAVYPPLIEKVHSLLREYKADGEGFEDYDFFPATPGLLQWGRGEDRKSYFWLTDGDPAEWPTIIYWDMEFYGRYDMPVVAFLERLVTGELDARFLGAESEPFVLNPEMVTFLPMSLRPL